MDNYEKIISDVVKKTIEVLRAGGIILYPTDTVWELDVMQQMQRLLKNI